MKIIDFYDKEYSQYAYYDTYRKCASYVDGLKPSMRKVIYVVDKNDIRTPIKVSQLAAKVSEQTMYLHGEQSLVGVITNMCQNFPTSNNVNFLSPKGNFGSRLIPEAAAARYIYACKSDWFDVVFNKSDFDILPSQTFEGETIEPRHYVPVVPVLLLNGSEGIGNGYAQKILPRNLKSLIKHLRDWLEKGSSKEKLIPHFNGFKGKIEIEGEKATIYGTFEFESKNEILVTELPVGYDLRTYVSTLNSLEENEIIKSYQDLSEENDFKFSIKIGKDFPRDEEIIFEKLKLKKTVVENYVCIDEKNKIKIFENCVDIIDAYAKIRLSYYEKRKKNLMEKGERETATLRNKEAFIRDFINGKIDIRNASDAELEKMMSAYEKIDDSWDYLLGMPMRTLTKKKAEELQKKLKDEEKKLFELKKKDPKALWLEDLEKIESFADGKSEKRKK